MFGGFVDASFYVSSKIKWVRKKVALNCSSSSDNWSLKRKTQTFRRNVVVHEFFVGRGYFFRADFPLEFSTKTYYSGVASNSIWGRIFISSHRYTAQQIITRGIILGCAENIQDKRKTCFSVKKNLISTRYFVTLLERSERYLQFKGNCNFEFSRQNQQ